ncbi:glycosyltransferase family 4 protein [Winogradskyella helgolandensis]|uniref:glycosyltransferase family 4 protein n=1 Tax=Winogradskyella helgolandensis TaxID=2697010 RepID=UPI0015CC11A2|nr:glycosyltransferase family 4 protein [Winogradskyella helgolandensis]
MKLVIISHTEHYQKSDGTIVGWGPTVTEINHLMAVFEEIVHLGMLYAGEAPASALPYTSSNIKFVNIPTVGGAGLKNKLKIITSAPKTLKLVRRFVNASDYFQLRTPTGIGVYLIPYLTWFTRTPGWYKYAGNWKQTSAPLGYAFQRWFLKRQLRTVTINGAWNDQPPHCETFENPCLTEADLALGKALMTTKRMVNPINLCYVGRLETPKGVGRVIDAVTALKPEDKAKLGVIHFVGDGNERNDFERQAALSGVDIRFHGFLSRHSVFEIYKDCHGFLMPTTASEGFPKVLAEAMNFGCVPIVSNISSIGQYIKTDDTGFVLSDIYKDTLSTYIIELINLSTPDYLRLVSNGQEVVKRFTFVYYNDHIKQAILN